MGCYYNYMKRKTNIISIVLLITTLFIGTLRMLIKQDTIQTKNDRLQYYSENLAIQKNTILNSLQNYSNLIIYGINANPRLNDLLRNVDPENSKNLDDYIKQIKQLSLIYYQHLSKVGFSFLSFTYQTNKNQVYRIPIGGEIPVIESSTADFSFLNQSRENTALNYCYLNKSFKYRLFYPQFQNLKSPRLYIETGFNFALLRELVRKNIPNSVIGFLYIGNDSIDSFSSESDIEFIQPDKKFQLYFDKQLSKEFKNYLNTGILKEISSRLINQADQVSDNNTSIYLTSRNKPKAITFCPLQFSNKNGNIFLVSVNDDYMLEKTNDWNNQIFIINLMIIILIMIGITYLFINRMSLLKEKNYIQESELKLKEMNESKDKFFSIIAHDLKNPFNGIMGMTGYLNESYDEITDKERKEIVSDLNISSKNAFNLLQNLLEWTRTQSGTIKNVPVCIEPESIIELALETVTNLAKIKEINIKLEIRTEKMGFADENLVTTILRNLFTNAVKFSPRNSVIEVTVKDYEKELVFCVKDSGIGLKSEEIDQLFRIDRNFHKKGTEEETGTGLGLKLCKEFVEYCHGRIWVISEPSNGSSFYFTIPVYSK